MAYQLRKTDAVVDSVPEGTVVTMGNVHTLQIYHLRKELERRGIWEHEHTVLAPKGAVNASKCMQRIVQEIMKEKEQEELKRHEQLEAEAQATRERWLPLYYRCCHFV
jgi:hypothetical protein